MGKNLTRKKSPEWRKAGLYFHDPMSKNSEKQAIGENQQNLALESEFTERTEFFIM